MVQSLTQIHKQELLLILIGIRLAKGEHIVYNEHIEMKKELK